MTEQQFFEGLKSDNQKIIQACYINNKDEFRACLTKMFPNSSNIIEDYYHESFYQMYRNIKNGRLTELTCKLTTYLISIGKNLINNDLRKEGKKVLKNEPIDEDSMDPNRLEKATEQSKRLDIVSESVYNLTEPCKSILTLFYWNKMSLSNMLTKLHDYTSTDALKTQKYKCMQRLEKILRVEFKNAGLI